MLKIEKNEERKIVEQPRRERDDTPISTRSPQSGLQGSQPGLFSEDRHAGQTDLNTASEDFNEGLRGCLRIATLDRPISTLPPRISKKDTEDLKPSTEDLHEKV
uniref:Uncharacterized protein n=1 Tax=Pristionchus pacificus TaxID=54126 RepID=A0A2A6BCE4_PRIPA|eukprot:PDM63559.1 hypothetical protein PRIPAC_49532 [Pristionchus pacificus]